MNLRQLESAVHFHTRRPALYRGMTSKGWPKTREGHTLSQSMQEQGALIWWAEVDGRVHFMVQPVGGE